MWGDINLMADKLELFPIPDKEFSDGAAFRDYLVETYDPSQVEHELTIVLGLTNYSTIGELVEALKFSGFAVQRVLGFVYHMKYGLPGGPLEFYMTYDNDTRVVVFYTNFRKTEEIPAIYDFLEKDPNTCHLFLKPVLIEKLIEELIERHENLKITEFAARRSAISRFEAPKRPEYKRTISYWGEDGKETLQELKQYYGVLPGYLTIDIPGTIKFKVAERGLFTFWNGDLRVLFGILGTAVDEARKMMRAFNGSSFKVLPIKTAKKSFAIPSSTPISIFLKNPLLYSEIPKFQAQLDAKNYTIVNLIAQEGSLFLSADVVSESGYSFRIKADENRIKMFPEGETNFLAFMEFYEFIIHSIDPEAELQGQ